MEQRVYTYENQRPMLVIEIVGGSQLGNCYSSTVYRVTVRTKLDANKIKALRDAGVLGFGQELRTISVEEKEDLYQVETWQKKMVTMKFPYFIYTFNCLCDSSD